MVVPTADIIDTKPYVEHDPLLGYRYVAGTQRLLPRPGGGQYELSVNSAGIRSSRDYSKQKPAGVYRILVFGDSYAAGQFVSNDQRFTEIMERRVDGLEVINFALEGTGTDQQLLMYEERAAEYEHDLVMVLPFLQNIRRNLVDARVAFDARTGARVLRGKPRFELRDGELMLCNTPVPVDQPSLESSDSLPEQSESSIPNSDDRQGWGQRVKAAVSRSAAGVLLKKALFAVKPWEPFPEYRSSDSAAWLLMGALLRRFKEQAGERPLVIVPVFYDSYVRFRMARNYWERFRSLAGPGVEVIDLLPHYQRLGAGAVRCFQVPYDCHFSSHGHLVLADALLAELTQKKLLTPAH